MPKQVLDVAGTRSLERYVFCEQRVPSLIVMENAAWAVTERICIDYPKNGNCLVLCGTGNNGGDGFALARQLAVAGWKVAAWALGVPENRSSDAKTMLTALRGSGISYREISDEAEWETALASLGSLDILVDAVFGIGLNRMLPSFYQRVFRDVNDIQAAKYAVDMPSGVDADTGRLWGEAILADCTVTFFAAKPGQLLYPGRKYAGNVCVAELNVDDGYGKEKKGQIWLQPEDLLAYLPRRKADAHKGNFGHGLLIGGSVGMVGAVQHAARAALRSGIGLLSLATPKEVASSIWTSLPEAMAYPLDITSSDCVAPLLEGKNCIALGPGLGRKDDSAALLSMLLKSRLPLILDADALYALTQDMDILKERGGELLLTPHPGEMARLCGVKTEDVLQDPRGFAVSLAQTTGAVVLLKGGSSVIAAPDGRIAYNTSGGPALAKGGSGDALCGIALAALGQGLEAYEAACCASLLLGLAADSIELDEKAVLTSDVIEAIPLAFHNARILAENT